LTAVDRWRQRTRARPTTKRDGEEECRENSRGHGERITRADLDGEGVGADRGDEPGLADAVEELIAAPRRPSDGRAESRNGYMSAIAQA